MSRKTSAALFLVLLTVSCSRINNNIRGHNTKNSTTQKMEKKIQLKPNESYQLTLQSRGAMGLQLMYRCEDTSVVEVTRSDYKLLESDSTKIGNNIPALYKIKALKRGKTRIQFYETQPWNKDFKEVIREDILVEVQ